MSNDIATAYSRKFQAGIEMLAQQFPSITEDTLEAFPDPQGEAVFFDQVGAVILQDKTGRAVDIPQVETPHKRRMITPIDKYARDFIDTFDQLKVLNDPTNSYTMAFNAAGQRAKDKIVVDALLGTAYTGKSGTTAVVLPSAQKIAKASAGFTFAKLQEAIRLLRKNNAIMPGEQVTCLYTSFQEKEFLNTTEVKNFDYNTVKVLVDGEANTFYTVRFKRLEDVSTTLRMLPYASSTRSCLLYPKSAGKLAKWKDVYGRVSFIDEKEAYQVMAGLSAGCTRSQEEKVIQIDCVE